MSNSTDSIKQCILKSRNYKFRDISLSNMDPVFVGRGPMTRIRDRKCSKTQIQITANYATKKATILQLGTNPSEVNGNLLTEQTTKEIDCGSSINLLRDDLKYTIEFLTSEPESRSKHKHHAGPSKSDAKRLKTDNAEDCADVAPSAPTLSDFENDNDYDSNEEAEETSSSYQQTLQSTLKDMTSLSTTERWEEYDHSKIFIFTPSGLRAQPKVAAFDLDNTIICTKSGKVFPISMEDWKIIFAEVPGKLKQLHEQGHKIIFFTNQKGISRGRTSAPEFKKKVQRIVQKLGVPIQVMVSTGSGKYRKPNTGMWDYFLQKCNGDVEVDIQQCIYVGDAAGRLEKWAPKKKKDFSCADRLFALNVGLKFFTPEEFFMGQKAAPYKMPTFDPRNIKSQCLATLVQPPPTRELTPESIVSSTSEVIIFVGFPASGKSHFADSYLIPKGYVHINRDTLGSWQKCVSECSRALSRGEKVVVDNTNPDLESRARYIELAKKFEVPCRCFLFDCGLEQAKHNNTFRELLTPDEKHASVNDMVLNSYKSKFREPHLKEGFTELIKVNFVPKFKNRHEEKLFKKFLIEK